MKNKLFQVAESLIWAAQRELPSDQLQQLTGPHMLHQGTLA